MRIDRGKLAAELRVRDYTQKAFSERAGISRGTVNAILSGKTCTDATAQKIADALGVNLKKIVEL